MAKVVNIDKCFEKFNDTYSPKMAGHLNGQHVKVVRLDGGKVPWHIHEKEDEMFFVVDGVLDIHVVPRGHVKLILFEPEGIAHTGKVK